MHLRIASSIASALAALVLVPSMARADDTQTETLERPREPAPAVKPFGSRGQVALDDLTGFRFVLISSATFPNTVGTSGIFSYSTSTTDGPTSLNASRTTIAFNPSIDYFVTDHVSIGGAFGLGYQRTRSTQADSNGLPFDAIDSGFGVSFEPRVGYVLRVADDIILWPRVGFGYDVTRSSRQGDDGINALDRTLRAQADLGLIFRAGRHFYVNLGPRISFASTIVSSTEGQGWHTSTTTFGGGANVSLGLLL